MKPASDHEQGYFYLIRIQGHLDEKWSDWFDGFIIEYSGDNTTLRGAVPDQGALHGLFAKIRDLGLVLCRVELAE